MGHKVYQDDFEIGQWVKFETANNIAELSSEEQNIYRQEAIFLVISREDKLYDAGRCYLVDNNGQLFDSCPRMQSLNSITFTNMTIKAYSHEEADSIVGKEKMLEMVGMAQKHLQDLSEYFNKYGGKILDASSILEKQDFPKGVISVYKGIRIPVELWNFFDSEQGFSTDQLLQAIDKALTAKKISSFQSPLSMLITFHGYELIRYYNSSAKFTFDELLQYAGGAVRDFICYDKKFQFHNWLLKHNLSIPEYLVCNLSNSISYICSDAGIEYLNRKILTKPESERQNQLNELVVDSCKLGRDMEQVLNDVLVGKHEVSWNTINYRFAAFQKRELQREAALASKYTQNGIHSLFWQAAKKIAKLSLPCEKIPEVCNSAVEDAKSLKFL